MLHVNRKERGFESLLSSFSLSFGSPEVLLEEGTYRAVKTKSGPARRQKRNTVLEQGFLNCDCHTQATAKRVRWELLEQLCTISRTHGRFSTALAAATSAGAAPSSGTEAKQVWKPLLRNILMRRCAMVTAADTRYSILLQRKWNLCKSMTEVLLIS